MSFAQLFDKLMQTRDHNPFSPHKIEFYLILIAAEDGYAHFVDFKLYELSAGSALFIAKNQVHHFSPGLKKVEGYCLVFSSHFIDEYYASSSDVALNRLFNYHIESPVIYREEIGQDSFLAVARMLYDEYIFPNDFSKSEVLRTLLHALLLKAERAKDFQSVDGVKTEWMKTFNVFKNLLEKEYATTRSSREYAAKLFISYKLLNDIVKKVSGKTVKAFIDDFVIIEIKRYLVSTSLSVNEVSYKTGFEEPANMVRFFRKKTGVTPLRFRKRA